MPELATLIERYLAERWRGDPVAATAMGVHTHDHRLGDYSPDAVEEAYRKRQELLVAFRSLDDTRFSRLERLDWRLAVSELETDVELHRLRLWQRSPAMYADLAIGGVYFLTVRTFAPLRERLAAVRDRLRAYTAFLEVGRANLTEDTPAVFAEVGQQMAAGGLEFLRTAIPALVEQIQPEDPSLGEEVRKANEAAQAALQDFVAFVQDLQPRAQGDFAIGREMFDFLLQRHHLLDLDSDGLYALGARYFESTEAQLRDLAASLDPGKSWPELVEELKQHHPEPGGVLEAYREEMERARRFTAERDLATFPPGEVLEVMDTPSFLRSTVPYAAYEPPPPFDADMRGLFYVTPVSEDAPPEVRAQQLQGHCYLTLPIVALHEAYPGHHLQLARAKLIDSPGRRAALSSLFAEGWALYCEEMMFETGFYTDPRVRLFQLKDMLWRSARVLVDVGLHTRGMTFAEAVNFMVHRVKLERPNAEAEVRRYTMTPTQPMSYLMGKHLIMDLRQQYQRRQGSSFRLKEFHDTLLSFGTIPPPLVIEQMLA